MKYANRQGNIVGDFDKQDRLTEFLYKNPIGKLVTKVLIQRPISELGGAFLNTKVSKLAIKPFVKANDIDLQEYEDREFTSYNDFFMRKIARGFRTIDKEPSHFISPCDGKLMVYTVDRDGKIPIKGGSYTIKELLRNFRLGEEYGGGLLLKFRLSVDDYHRYCYVDDGRKSKNRHIKGCFHTVNPIAEETEPIYKENSREYCQILTENFGKIIQMEVGATMVGKIVNYHEAAQVTRGEEKGRFSFGGSTIIVIVKKDVLKVDEDILANSAKGLETKVFYGEKIGEKIGEKLTR